MVTMHLVTNGYEHLQMGMPKEPSGSLVVLRFAPLYLDDNHAFSYKRLQAVTNGHAEGTIGIFIVMAKGRKLNDN